MVFSFKLQQVMTPSKLDTNIARLECDFWAPKSPFDLLHSHDRRA